MTSRSHFSCRSIVKKQSAPAGLSNPAEMQRIRHSAASRKIVIQSGSRNRTAWTKLGILILVAMLLGITVSCDSEELATSTQVQSTPVSSPPSTIVAPEVSTSTPRPVWQIVLAGVPCPEHATCNETLFMKGPPQLYAINTDGTAMTSLAELIPAVASTAQVVKFSADGSRVAYPDNYDVVLINASGSNKTRLQNALARGSQFDFVGNECVAVYVYDKNDSRNRVTVEKHCSLQLEPIIIGTVDFSTPQGDYFRSYQISPQGDKLLSLVSAYNLGELQLYLKEMDDNIPPLTLFQSPPQSCARRWHQSISSYHWQSNGEAVNLLWFSQCDDRIENIFYTVDWRGEELRVRGTVQDIVIQGGDWSPDNQGFAFWYIPVQGSLNSDTAGLYVIDFNSNTWEQVLGRFYLVNLSTWPVDVSKSEK